ncbi:MAG: DUF4390 domain-containing protein [Gammaproteobacteria bacterium]|jgi:hypothetical protein
MRINRHSLIRGILYCLPLLVPVAARAQVISVEYATSHVNDGIYQVDIRLKMRLNDEIINALKHGVSLNIDVNLEVRRERKWLWNKLIKEVTLHYRLQHHPLSDDFVVTKLGSGAREQFNNLDEALNYIGAIDNYPLIDKARLSGDESYIGLVRAEINIESLPPPLQPSTLISSRWHLESQWYEWVFR